MSGKIAASHMVADWLLGTIDDLLNSVGLGGHARVEQMIYVCVIVAIAAGLGWVMKRIILAATQKVVKLRHTQFGFELLRQKTLTKCAHVITPLVFLALVPFGFDRDSDLLDLIERVTCVYLAFAVGYGLNAVLSFVFTRYNDKENTRNLPLKGVLNIGRGIVWGVVTIVAVAVLFDKSPTVLLTGLGAFAAALMLVFKDSILGFVAGIQMSQNDMLHVGDWIVVEGTEANGVVEDVSLTTVKIRNFDMTLVMVPPYRLVSTSFRNWRGMQEKGARRIMLALIVNPATIRRIGSDTVDALGGKYPEVKDFAGKLSKAGVTMLAQGGTAPVNGTVDTNLGLFRGYLGSWLSGREYITKDQYLMVRVMAPTPEGVPLQIYCFANTTVWTAYEAILSAVMEHAMASASDFGLEVYSGVDLSVRSENMGTNPKSAGVAAAPAGSDK